MLAIGLGAGLLMGIGAVVVDVGELYVEREELQSGADAAALAIAKACAKSPATCASQAGSGAIYANINAKDGKSRITTICGTGQGLPVCPAPAGNLTACLGASAGTYVEVRTATETTGGGTVLPARFARTLAGYEDSNGTTVAACARAAWGSPSQVNGVAVTMSYCAWNKLTDGGTRLGPPPPATPPAAAEGVIYLHGSHTEDNCAPGNSGWQAPGGFSWLDESGPCSALVPGHGVFGGSTGVSASADCQERLEQARTNRTVLWMPVFDGVRGTGQNIEYRLRGVSAFVVTGYRLSSFNAASTLSGGMLCNGSDRCIYGYFTTALVPSPSLDDSIPSYGVKAVTLVG
jgi:Flp pilus assembly protein TadG